jgi:RND family efflux transporter MFP subunit
MTLSRSTLSLLTVVILVGGLSAGVAYRLWPENENVSEEGAGDAGASDELPADVSASQQFATNVPQPVMGVAARRDTLWITVTAAGQAEAFRSSTLTALVPGQVTRVPVEESQRVPRGGLLVQIDTTEYALAVARARADMLSAEAEFRQMVLFNDQVESEAVRAERERIARSRSGLDQAEVSLREAQLDLARTQVVAPFAGSVADLEVVDGQYVGQNAELLTVVELNPIKVEVQVLEAEVGYLSSGRRAAVTFAAFPGEVFRGRINTINPRVDPETRTARVTVLLDNPDGRIKPGMYARVSIEAESIPDQVLVPRTAVLERDRRTMLFVFEGEGDQGRAKWRYVTTGAENDSLVALLPDPETSMVDPGEIVLVDGHHYLVHDATIRLEDDPGALAGRPGR